MVVPLLAVKLFKFLSVNVYLDLIYLSHIFVKFRGKEELLKLMLG